MTKCEHFKDQILTDFIDGQLDKSSAGILENHLLDCSECRIFFKEVKNNVKLPFQNVISQQVPAELWSAIREQIEEEKMASNPVVDFIEKLKGLIVVPKLVPVFASVALMFLVASATLNTIHFQQARDRDQGEYLVSLLSTSDVTSAAESSNGKTPIESYFL